MHWLSPFFCLEEKFGPLEKKDKKQLTSQLRLNFSEQPGTPFVTTKGRKKFWES
jgi:hypothetical protein